MGAEQSAQTPLTEEHEEEEIYDEDPTRPPSALVICGPSGVGKGTLIELLLEDSDGFAFCVSHTTRRPRGAERDGVEYHFVRKEEFERGIDEKAFLEYARVHDHYYGTSRTAVEKVLNSGACCILDIDVQGARQVRQSAFRAVFVFVAPPSEEELEKRLRGRGTDSEEQILRRLKAARTEMQSMSEPGLFDFCIVNGDLSQAYAELRMIAVKARSGVLPEALENGTLSPIKTEKESPLDVSGMEAWKKKIALVTDAGSAQGTELCMALSKVGMRLIAVGRNRADLEKLQGAIVNRGHTILAQNFLPVVCDTTKEEEVLSLRKIAQKRWPNASSVDALINIASYARKDSGIIDGAATVWAEMLNENVLGTLMCCREVIKDMQDRDESGHILNVAIMDTDAPSDAAAMFKATSNALCSLSADLRNQVKQNGTRASVVSMTSDRAIDAVCVTQAVLSVLSAPLDVTHITL